MFLLYEGEGNDTVNGGTGANWIDTIELHDAFGGSDIGTFGVDWTLSLNEGSITSQNANSITLSEDADGVITLEDNTQISFQDIETIQW